MSGTPYTISVENQFPNVQPNGLVVLTGDGTRSTLIPWGAHVSVVVDTFSPSIAFGCRQAGKVGGGTTMNALSINVVQ